MKITNLISKVLYNIKKRVINQRFNSKIDVKI